MSHFTVLVIGDNIEEQLYPYWELDLSKEELINDPRSKFKVCISQENIEEETKKFNEDNEDCKNIEEWIKNYYGYYFNEKEDAYGYYYNPNSKWDWYTIGGRWSGFFKPKEGKNGLLGSLGTFNNKPREGWVDQIKKCDIDVEGMRKEAEKEYGEYYDKFQKVLNGRTPPVWEEVLKNNANIEEARKIYNENEIIKNLSKEGFWNFEQLLVPREKYIQQARESAIITYAVVINGIWYQRGEMGWWGISSNEKDKDVWNKEFNKLIDELPDDTLFTLVDCHI